jgi:hypothetical protein
VDLVGIELADFDELLDFGNAHLAAAGDHRVEVPRRLSKDKVAGLVAFPSLHERDLGRDAGLQNVFFAVENFRLLALGQLGAEAGASVEPRDARAAGAQSLGQRSLRNELEFQFARQHLALEFLVLPNIRGHDLFHLPGGEQNAHAEAIYARIVAHDGEAFHAAVMQRGDEVFRNAAQSEPTRGDGHVVVEQAGQRRLCV